MTSSRDRLYALSCAAMFVFGMILGLPGTVLGQPETVAQFGLTLADRGVLIATLFLGLLFGSLVSGPVVNALGLRASLAASAALAALCLPLLAAASNATLAAISLASIGLASATINTASNALSSDLFPEERGRRMNGIAVMVGLGGLAMPTATVLASFVLSWRAVVIGGGALAALVAVLSARATLSNLPREHSMSAVAALRHFSGRRGFIWFCLLILLGGGNEASMAGWTSGFLVSAGFSAASATWVLSSHWLGLIVARILFAGRVDAAKALAVERSAVLSAVLLLVLVVSTSPAVLAAGPFVIGVAMALAMPTSLALAGERFQGNAGALFGGLLTLAQVGGMALPSAIGFVGERAGLRLGLALLIVSYGAIALVVRHVGPRATE